MGKRFPDCDNNGAHANRVPCGMPFITERLFAVYFKRDCRERNLGVTTEFLLKDACLQVTEADLLAFKNSRARWRASSNDTTDTGTQTGPSRGGSSGGLYDSTATEDVNGTASRMGRIAASNSAGNVSFEQPDIMGACQIGRTQRRRTSDRSVARSLHDEEEVQGVAVEQRQHRRRRRRRRGTRDFSCQTDEV
jgi:hypothetical protein